MTTNKSKPLVVMLVGLLSCSLAQAQVSVNTAGGDAKGSGGAVAFSVGQTIYTTNSGNIEHGVQHAYQIVLTGSKETTFNISITAFPNPTTDNLSLQIGNYYNEPLLYQLYDMQGKLLTNKKINTQQTQINMSGLISAVYFLNVVNQENKIIQSFKIIKN